MLCPQKASILKVYSSLRKVHSGINRRTKQVWLYTHNWSAEKFRGGFLWWNWRP